MDPRLAHVGTLAASIALLAVALSGCGRDEGSALTIFAAASLADAMEDVSGSFEALHEGVSVVVSTAGSQRLAAQIRDGAPADVFVSADRPQVDAVSQLVIGHPTVIAVNDLAIAVAPGNPQGVRGLEDLARPDLRVVLAAPEVPAGHYARRALERAGVVVEPADLTLDVRSALSKVALGEADAALVYRSDVESRDAEVDGVAVDTGVRAEYVAVVLRTSDQPALARAFVDHLRSADGQRLLTGHGFQAP